MSKLVFNDDGTITVPLKPPKGDPTPREVVLPEPSMRELALMHVTVAAADDKLPSLPPAAGQSRTPTELEEAGKVLRERTLIQFSDESPHGQALIDIIKLLTDTDVSPDELYGWAANPTTCNQILGHFQSPLPGKDTE